MAGIGDFLDKKFLTTLQERFADLLGFSVVFEDLNAKPISKKRCFKSLACKNYIDVEGRLGHDLCWKSDKDAIDIAISRRLKSPKRKAYLYSCHMGFSNVAIPIVVSEVAVGSLYAGQFFAQKPENYEEAYRGLYEELGQPPSEISKFFHSLDNTALRQRARDELLLNASDVNALVDVYNKEKQNPKEPDYIIKAIRLLSLVADTISTMASDLRRASKIFKERNRLQETVTLFNQYFSNISILSIRQKRFITPELARIEESIARSETQGITNEISSLLHSAIRKVANTELKSIEGYRSRTCYLCLIREKDKKDQLDAIQTEAKKAKNITNHLDIIVKLNKMRNSISELRRKNWLNPVLFYGTIFAVIGVIIAIFKFVSGG